MRRLRAIVLFFLMFVLLINIISCSQRDLTEAEIRMRNLENWERLPEDVQNEHRRAFRFVGIFWFDYEDMTGYGSTFVGRAFLHRGYRNIAFVASQEDSANGDDNTLYLWPSHITSRILTVLNHVLSDEDVDWEALPISYPVTMEDLVEHWEVVWDLCISHNVLSPLNRLIYPQS